MVASRGEPGLGHMGTGRNLPTNSGARTGGGRGPTRRRQVAPGTAGAAEPVGGRRPERSAVPAGPRPESARPRPRSAALLGPPCARWPRPRWGCCCRCCCRRRRERPPVSRRPACAAGSWWTSSTRWAGPCGIRSRGRRGRGHGLGHPAMDWGHPVMGPGAPPPANGITTIWTRVAPAIGQGHP